MCAFCKQIDVCLRQVFTGEVPWATLKDGEIIRAVGFDDRRPPRPSEPAIQRGLDDAMWNLMQACWKTNPEERPNMMQVGTRFTSDSSVQESIVKPDFFDPLSKRKICSSDDAELPSDSKGISGFVNMYKYSDLNTFIRHPHAMALESMQGWPSQCSEFL